MLTITDSPARDEIVAIVERHGGERTSLIPILQDVKKAQHEITDEAMQIVADLVGVHPVEVFSVATFYAFLHGAPEGRFVVRLCGTLSCDFAGKTAVAEALRVALGIDFGATTDDGVFTLEWASCVGMCDQGPALLVNDTRLHARHAREGRRDRRRLPHQGRPTTTARTSSPAATSSPTRAIAPDAGMKTALAHAPRRHRRHRSPERPSRAAAAPDSRPA